MNPPTAFQRLLLAGVCATSVLVASAWSAPSQITAQLDRHSLPLGESAQLAVTVKDSQPVELNVPPVDGLEITPVGQQSSMQVINGTVFAEVRYVYQVTPNRSGNFTIPAIAVPGGNSTQPIAFRVDKTPNPGSSPPPAPSVRGQEEDAAPTDAKGDSAFLRVVLPKRELTVGELIPVEIKACFPAGIAASLNGLPMLTGGAFALNKLDDNPEQTRAIINGQPYNVITWSSALSAVEAGDYPLNLELPVIVRVREKSKPGAGRSPFKDFFGDASPFDDSVADVFFDQVTEKPLALHSDGALLRIQPLPVQGRPPDFSGAVGKFDVSVEASVTRSVTGDPITLKMKITGQGNFDRVAMNGLASSAGWKGYKPNARFQPADREGFAGTKTFEQAIVPTRAGSSEIPALSFSYFDPDTRSYVTKTTSPIPVEIAPGSAIASAPAPGSAIASSLVPTATPPTERATDGLVPDRRETSHLSSLRSVVLEPWFLIINALMAAATAIGLLVRRWRQRRANDPKRVRVAAANAAVREAVSAMDEAIKNRNSVGFFHAARQAVVERLAERWSVPASRVTPAEIQARLNGSGENICALFKRSDEVTATKKSPPANLLNGTPTSRNNLPTSNAMSSNSSPKKQPAPENLSSKERVNFPPVRHRVAVRRRLKQIAKIEVKPVLLVAALAGVLMLGSAFAAEAAAPSQDSAPAFFNRGNALVREGKPGPAILAYERAQQLAPRDPAIAVYLKAVRDTAGLAAPTPPWWQSAARALTMNEWTWSGSLALALVCGATFFGRLLPTRLRQPLKTLSAVCALAVLVSITALIAPAKSAEPVFPLVEGEIVTAKKALRNFVFVRTADGRSGWVERAQIERIIPLPVPDRAG